MDNHWVRMASCRRKTFKDFLEQGREVFQFPGRLFLKHRNLGITLKNLCAVGSCRDLTRQIFSTGMPFHVEPCLPERPGDADLRKAI
jgi:hypothetical protein